MLDTWGWRNRQKDSHQNTLPTSALLCESLGGDREKRSVKTLEAHRRALSPRNGGSLSFADPVLLSSPPQTTLSAGPKSVKKPASLPASLPFTSSYNPDCLCLPAGPVFSFTCTCICDPFPKPMFLEGRFKREGTNIHLWLIHVAIWQKSNQYYKANILPLKINNLKNPKVPGVNSPYLRSLCSHHILACIINTHFY